MPGFLLLAAVTAVIAVALMIGVLQKRGSRRPNGAPDYVALGSSFAAGLGLGPRAPGSPLVCMRSCQGYPPQLARLLGLSLVDMSCSGASTRHVLRGGRALLGPQLRALTDNTRLVTLTIGGNDIGYVGDLTLAAAGHQPTLFGRVIRNVRKFPRPASQRDFAKLKTDLLATLAEVRRRSPHARIVLATYPTILPPAGTCSTLNISEAEASTLRAVGDLLAETTHAAAIKSGAVIVDMHSLGADHHACSAEPWVNGWHTVDGTKFHPTRAGAEATAIAIAQALQLAA